MSTRSNLGQAPSFFDVHTHVQFAAFKDDADLVIKRALDRGVWMINVGTQKDTSAKAIEFAEKYPEGLPAEVGAKAGVYATVGLHPIHTERSYHDPQELGISNSRELENGGNAGFTSREEEFDYDYYRKLAEHPKVVAVGECGLDYYRLEEGTKDRQFKAFRAQITLASEIKRPLMIHCRQAFPDLIGILNTKYKILNTRPAGVIHFFSGTKDDAKKLLDMGFSFSFGGVITFARDYDEVVKYIPLERIVLETDAPYVAPVPYRGKRNEPAYVIEVARKLSELKGIELEEASVVTTSNARNIFGI